VATGKVARRSGVSDVAELLSSPEVEALIASVEAVGDRRGRKGFGTRTLVGAIGGIAQRSPRARAEASMDTRSTSRSAPIRAFLLHGRRGQRGTTNLSSWRPCSTLSAAAASSPKPSRWTRGMTTLGST